MNFAVDWESDVRRELHLLWATAPDPPAVRGAAETVERQLGTDPYQAGKHLSEGLWRIVVPPLVAHYSIDASSRSVEITDVRLLAE